MQATQTVSWPIGGPPSEQQPAACGAPTMSWHDMSMLPHPPQMMDASLWTEVTGRSQDTPHARLAPAPYRHALARANGARLKAQHAADPTLALVVETIQKHTHGKALGAAFGPYGWLVPTVEWAWAAYTTGSGFPCYELAASARRTLEQYDKLVAPAYDGCPLSLLEWVCERVREPGYDGAVDTGVPVAIASALAFYWMMWQMGAGCVNQPLTMLEWCRQLIAHIDSENK